MPNADALKWQIEELREKLHQLVLDKQGNFIDEEVARMSAELDEIIVAYEKVKQTKR
ncbi:MAG: aspartyl-phosphate phosphatase Spo0E family protein [Veillonellaceae bacterium]|jgi:hypothetical protein|nr:aspartyl-phosphate phosphatase Spo0E family protein [Veillonellaceae bacterium]